ncbi:MAG: translation initiation factor IF-2 [Alphaproteobacteria bacterium RIFCSPHIGHO2_02_FULL_46_13]|nr:MAG: translation initiation factor IF-2 [Alphaproteobacteria bacterium RIFCSPHIGHO2_02_FULL_46_13]
MTEEKKTLSLGGTTDSAAAPAKKGTLSLKGAPTGQQHITQTLARGQSRGVQIEVRKKRGAAAAAASEAAHGHDDGEEHLTSDEKNVRLIALQKAKEEEDRRREEEAKRRALEAEEEKMRAQAEATGKRPGKIDAEELRRREIEELELIKEEDRKKAEELDVQRKAQEKKIAEARAAAAPQTPAVPGAYRPRPVDDDAGESVRDRLKRTSGGKSSKSDDSAPSTDGYVGRSGRMTVNQVLNEQYERSDNARSLSAVKRARQKAKSSMVKVEQVKQYRDVIVPETITVQELANRMSERGGDVIKSLMKMGVMATINQSIDADTAELIILEFGHRIKRVTEADVEIGIDGETDDETNLVFRPPVVTIMGHVDHGKTSLLDALRLTDVVSGEAGGITQHIGAYQITVGSGQKITFLDTPGHAAFTEMRARGANVTDIVVLVVAANDSIMPQTIEAISHAKAANAPMIVAINKIDLPDANPMKVKQDLLMHDVQVEEMGGDVICVELSAKKKINLDKLEEMILLQAEVLNLRANPARAAVGAVVESKVEQGRGSVATVLIQNGTLRIGDIFVVGSEWGRVRALLDDKGKQIKTAIPGQPVEVLGLSGTPDAGDSFTVVANEPKAREIVDYRLRKKKEKEAAIVTGTSFEQLLAQARDNKKELPIIIKADVHGSVEAIAGSLSKMVADNTEVGVRVLHTGVGAITESDVTLAKASGAFLVGFNVRANAQARDMAKRDKVEIRYYNIIYNIIDDVKGMLGGMLSPLVREEYLGQAQIREVFNVTKVGKIAGCMVTTGSVKRGAKVRLLRDDVVIHEGTLKTLKRFKDEVKEVQTGMECGMAFENYEDIREGDIIECFEVKEETRTLA